MDLGAALATELVAEIGEGRGARGHRRWSIPGGVRGRRPYCSAQRRERPRELNTFSARHRRHLVVQPVPQPRVVAVDVGRPLVPGAREAEGADGLDGDRHEDRRHRELPDAPPTPLPRPLQPRGEQDGEQRHHVGPSISARTRDPPTTPSISTGSAAPRPAPGSSTAHARTDRSLPHPHGRARCHEDPRAVHDQPPRRAYKRPQHPSEESPDQAPTTSWTIGCSSSSSF